MHSELHEVAKHMREFGMHILGSAVSDATFQPLLPFTHAVAVTKCAHGAEIVIKARIAQEHPLLIFQHLPSSTKTAGTPLDFGSLVKDGRTLMFSELPDRLWATTQYRIENLQLYKEFGDLRNSIMHFAVGNQDLTFEIYRFAFEVMEPMIKEFWDVSIIEYTDYAQDEHQYVKAKLQGYIDEGKIKPIR